MAMAMAMATAAAAVAAAAVIRPEHAEGGQNHENLLLNEKRVFRPILVISGPSRPQKWTRLEILHRTMSVSCQLVTLVRFYDQKRPKINEYVRKC